MLRVNRRELLRSGLLAAGGAPLLVRSSVLGAEGATSPSERVTLAVIGCGGMGTQHLKTFGALPDCEVVAGSDPRPDRRTAAESHLKPGGKVYTDPREVIARNDIDAVCIATPDHNHAWLAAAALRAGKDVYLEKPLTHTIREGRLLVEEVRRHARVFQVGTQRRAHPRHRLSCELVRNGYIGTLHTIRARLHPGLSFTPAPDFPPDPVPEGYDWDGWLGPAPFVPFSRRMGYWTGWSNYSHGQVTHMDSHNLDIAVWGAEPFLKGPVEVEPRRDPHEDLDYCVTFTFASGLRLLCEAPKQLRETGIRFEGTEGWVHVNVYWFTHQAQPASLLDLTLRPGEVHLHAAADNWGDFIQAVQTRGDTLCPVGTGHKMTTLCHLIWIAEYLGRRLRWDTEAERFLGDDEANRLLHYAYREPYHL
ncbi:MAG: Gfo/Idh/MocA family oxidoreductase [Planctomycetes bacterium]|nr:Gfo/Idh/MocA family oxidoreductase [Planctomycetota bacterium]